MAAYNVLVWATETETETRTRSERAESYAKTERIKTANGKRRTSDDALALTQVCRERERCLFVSKTMFVLDCKMFAGDREQVSGRFLLNLAQCWVVIMPRAVAS